MLRSITVEVNTAQIQGKYIHKKLKNSTKNNTHIMSKIEESRIINELI